MPPQPATLAPGEQLVCTGIYTLTQADLNSGEVVNTATADSGTDAADDEGPTRRRCRCRQAPALTLAKDRARST